MGPASATCQPTTCLYYTNVGPRLYPGSDQSRSTGRHPQRPGSLSTAAYSAAAADNWVDLDSHAAATTAAADNWVDLDSHAAATTAAAAATM